MSSTTKKSAIQFENLHFLRRGRTILQDINWELPAAAWGAILGPNGSGKSTLLRIASGYLWPTRGTVRVLGYRLDEHPLADIRRNIGVVEALSIYPFDEGIRAVEAVCTGFFGKLTLAYDQPTPAQWERAAQLLCVMRLEYLADQLFGTLSTGEKMRVLIARALVQNPALLLLDEPTTGLDLPTRENFLATLEQLRQTAHPPALLMITHHLEEIPPPTRHVLLLSRRGTVIAQGHPRRTLTGKLLSEAFEWPIQVVEKEERFYAHSSPQIWSR